MADKPIEQEVKAAVEPEAKLEPKPAPKPESKPEAKPEAKPETKAEKKEEKKPETKKIKIVPGRHEAELKLFNQWDTKEVKVSDISLSAQINLQSKKFPHTFGRKSQHRFEKREISIVERLVDKVMRSGQGKRKLSGKYVRGRSSCGKKLQAMRIVKEAFEKIEAETKENPVQVLVKAIENSAPREDVTRFKRGGISYSQAVDVAPLRRIDEALKNIAVSGFTQSFNNKTDASASLAKEIMLAAKEDQASFSVKRRNEVERIAAGSR